MIIRETALLTVSNPVVTDPSNAFTEGLIADLKIKEVRAIYPMIKAINSGRLTKNYTLYPAESLIGKNNKVDNSTGYASFVKPYGKPIILEHQLQKDNGLFGNIEDASLPMGRVVFAGFRRRQEKIDGPATPPSKKYIPGTVEGDGTMLIVPAITSAEAIPKVLGGIFKTVSIGANVENVWESISSKNIAELRRKGEELPPYERGQLYEGNLSYWRMGEIKGLELSFVNVPSDEYAGVADPDIGAEGIRLLVAEKKSGKSNEYSFFDAKTAEKVEFQVDECSWDESFFVDSAKVGQDIWWLKEEAQITESVKDETTESPEYCCPDHPNQTSNKADKCPICDKKMQKMDDEDEAAKKESEEKSMAKGIDLEVATVDEIIENYTEESLKELILQKFTTDSDVTDLVNGKGESIKNGELFSKISDFATKVCGDWNESAAKLALSLYLSEGGEYSPLIENEEADTNLSLGSLYLLDESDEDYNNEAKLTTKGRDALPDSAFCGPNRSFPVHDRAHAIAALRLIGRYKGSDKAAVKACIERKAKKFGVGGSEAAIELYPIIVETKENEYAPLLTIRNVEELDKFINEISTFAECYGLTDVQKDSLAENFAKAGTSFTELFPDVDNSVIALERENLVHYILNSETSESRKELVTLVGLIRMQNITKETLDSAYNAYNVFGAAVLKKFLESVPDKPVEITPAVEAETQEEDSTKSIETLSDPVAATEESKEKSVSVNKSKDVWLGTRVRPTKRSGKNPVNK